MIRRSCINAKNIKLVILDEADEMLSSGFKEQVYEYSDPYLTKEEAIRDIKTKIENK
jgi:hypothetical protein